MPISLLVPLIAQVGLPLATELMKIWEGNPAATVTAAQILALHAKWGTMTADDYLKQATAPVQAS